MPIELTVIIPVVTAIIGAAIGVIGAGRAARKDASEEGKNDGVILAQLGSLQTGVNDIKQELRDQGKTNIEVLTRLTAVESSVKQAHKRLDGMGAPHSS